MDRRLCKQEDMWAEATQSESCVGRRLCGFHTAREEGEVWVRGCAGRGLRKEGCMGSGVTEDVEGMPPENCGGKVHGWRGTQDS